MRSSHLSSYGPTVLITGASSGIGLAFAKEVARQGLQPLLVARRESLLKSHCEVISQQTGVPAAYYVCDLTEPNQIEALFQFSQEHHDIGLLVNNAGFGLYEPFAQSPTSELLRMLDLNCRSVLHLTHLFLAHFQKRQRSGVIFTSSIIAELPSPHFALYAATKAFELSLGRALHVELKGKNIDLLTLKPGLTRSEFHDVANLNARSFGIPMRTSEQVADTALRALGKKREVTDGLINRLLLFVVQWIPLSLFLRLSQKAAQKRKKTQQINEENRI